MWIVFEELLEMNKTMKRAIYFLNTLLLYISWQPVESGFRNWLHNN